MEAIANLSGKTTIILIAHRLSTIQSANNIFEIHDGQVIAEGKYHELLSCSKTFRAMTQVSDSPRSNLF